MANMIFNLDLNKNNAINPIIFGRLTDGNLRKITVNITNEGEPVDLTDWVIRFEGTTGGRAKVFDVLGVNILDAKNGKFEYTFSKTAFSASGAYTTAYFAIEKDNMRETTNDIKIVVENIADLDAQDAETVVTELNKTIALINQKYDELNSRVDIYENDITDLEDWLASRKAEIEDLIDLANSNFNEKLTEIQTKLDKINQAIEKGSETIAYAYSADGTDRFTTVYPNLNLLDGTRDFNPRVAGNNTPNQNAGEIYFTQNKKISDLFKAGDYITISYDIEFLNTDLYNSSDNTFTQIQMYGGAWTWLSQVKAKNMNGKFYTRDTFKSPAYVENPTHKVKVSRTIQLTQDFITANATVNRVQHMYNYIPVGANTNMTNLKIEPAKDLSSTATPWMPSSSEVTTDDYPKYIGYSNMVKTNKSSSDYTWFPDLTNKVEDHVNNKSNPHAVTANQVGSYTKSEVATLISEAIKQSKLDANPIGTILITISNTNPSTYLGGTWARFANGRTLVGVDENDSVTLMKTANNTGGSTNPLTRHSHDISRVNGTTQSAIGATISWSDLPNNGGVVKESGDNTNHNNWQPFMTVYFWRRTA